MLESQEDTSDTVEETEQEEGEMTDEIPLVTPEPQEIFVDVCGAVNQPGVYEMAAGQPCFSGNRGSGRNDGRGFRDFCQSGTATQ